MFLSVGLGYVGGHVAGRLYDQYGIQTYGTSRTLRTKSPFIASISTDDFNAGPKNWASSATHILISVPPEDGGCPVFRAWGDVLKSSPFIKGIYYLSSTGVYGDHKGNWVSEKTPAIPQKQAAKNRQTAENQWLSLESQKSIFIFRLSGIYGPGRSVLDRLQSPDYVCVSKPGHVFSRIHVDDIASAVLCAYGAPDRRGIYNLADDLPASSWDVACYGATLLNRPPPPMIPYDRAQNLSPRLLNFYDESRRVSNEKSKNVLGLTLRYPTYIAGLRQCLLDF